MTVIVMASQATTPLIERLREHGFAPLVVQELRTSPRHVLSFYGRRFCRAPAQVLGEIAYQALTRLQLASGARGVSTAVPDLQVESINASATVDFVRRMKPDNVFLDGTSIARKNLIEAVRPGGFFNIHCGINPLYRGSGNPHALIRGDLAHLGVTFHQVDAGIDTGPAISRRHVPLEAADTSLAVYQQRCYRVGVELIIDWLGGKASADDFAGASMASNYYPQLTLRSYLRAERALKQWRSNSSRSGE